MTADAGASQKSRSVFGGHRPPLQGHAQYMTAKQFFDWQTAGGTNDVVRFVEALEEADIPWCTISGVAVNHCAREPMVTQDVDFVVAIGAVENAIAALEKAGFCAEKFEWSVNFGGTSKVALQLSTEEFYREFPLRGVAADVHGIPIRVASLEDTLRGKIKAWSDAEKRRSKQIKDLADIARLVEAHPRLWDELSDELKNELHLPGKE
jgi:hypothetical protein